MANEQSAQQADTDGRDGQEAPNGAGEPQWANYRYRDEKVKREKAVEAQRVAEAKASALEAELYNFKGRLAKLEAPDQPKQEAPETRLSKVRALASRIAEFDTIVATSENADEVAAAKAELRKVRPEHRVQLMEEMAALTGEQAKSSMMNELGRRDAAQQGARALQASLASEFGDDVFNLASPLMRLAAEKLKPLVARYGSDESGALSHMAIMQAKAEMDNRDGRGELKDSDRRRLAVEGDARRAAGPANMIAALNSGGDWKSRAAAADGRIDKMLSDLNWR